MEVESLGSALLLSDVPIGAAYLSETKRSKYVGIKARNGYVVKLDMDGPEAGVPKHLRSDHPGTVVLHLPRTRFLLARNPRIISLNDPSLYNPGEIYLRPDGIFLACANRCQDLPPVSFLLNIETGEAGPHFDFRVNHNPIMIDDWELVAESARNSVVLCQHSA